MRISFKDVLAAAGFFLFMFSLFVLYSMSPAQPSMHSEATFAESRR